jgi:hypothetical protein
MTSANTQQLIIAIENAATGSYRGWTIGSTDDPKGHRRAVGECRDWNAWRCCCPATARSVLGFFAAQGMRLYDYCNGPKPYVYIYSKAD